MTLRNSIPTLALVLLSLGSCTSQETPKKEPAPVMVELPEPHRYGGWYCPDNFGFVPVDIQKLSEVPAISNRLPTEEELKEKKSLIKVDTEKYPNARALEMDLPRVARVHTRYIGMDELAIIIQAIVVNNDTVVGYRFPNGGNGSARIGEVTFLSDKEVSALGSQPFFYTKAVVNATKEDIWRAFCQTDYAKQLGEKFNKQYFFQSEWSTEAEANLQLERDGEKATGYVGTVYGCPYLQIDYDRNGFHYSEKLLMRPSEDEKTIELHFACGPFPTDLQKQQAYWTDWFNSVKKISEKGK